MQEIVKLAKRIISRIEFAIMPIWGIQWGRKYVCIYPLPYFGFKVDMKKYYLVYYCPDDANCYQYGTATGQREWEAFPGMKLVKTTKLEYLKKSKELF